MNQNPKTRVVRWFSTLSIAFLCGTAISPSAFGQLPMPIGTGVSDSNSQRMPDYEWQVGESKVMQAAPTTAQQPWNSSEVVNAGGQINMPPILSPKQTAPEQKSSMLAPIQLDSAPVVQDTLVTPATAQWPAGNGSPNYRIATGSASRNMPVQIQPMDFIGNQTAVYNSYQEPAGNDLPPIVQGQVVPDPMATQNGPPPSSMLISPDVPSVVEGQTTQSAPSAGGQMPESTYFNQGYDNPIYNPGTCPSCGGAGCAACGSVASGVSASACQSCGPNGCYNEAEVANRFGNSGSVSDATRYFKLDIYAMRRTDGDFGATNAGLLPEFSTQAGWRIGLGRRKDATRGDELVYLGLSKDDRTRDLFGPAANLNALFIPGGGLGDAQTSAFFNATRQIESSSTFLHSIQYNRNQWLFDVARKYVGIRANYIQDEYSLFSQNFFSGNLNIRADNFMIGPQAGLEVFYDVGYRFSLSASGEIMGLANFTTLDTFYDNGGITYADRNIDANNFAYGWDVGFVAHYQLTPEARLRLSYTGLWLYDVVSATDNVPPVLTSAVGSTVIDTDSMIFQGIGFGLEIFRK
jgi:hypothetical protein